MKLTNFKETYVKLFNKETLLDKKRINIHCNNKEGHLLGVDKTPSLQISDNGVYCYVCGEKHSNPVEMIQKLKGVSEEESILIYQKLNNISVSKSKLYKMLEQSFTFKSKVSYDKYKEKIKISTDFINYISNCKECIEEAIKYYNSRGISSNITKDRMLFVLKKEKQHEIIMGFIKEKFENIKEGIEYLIENNFIMKDYDYENKFTITGNNSLVMPFFDFMKNEVKSIQFRSIDKETPKSKRFKGYNNISVYNEDLLKKQTIFITEGGSDANSILDYFSNNEIFSNNIGVISIPGASNKIPLNSLKYFIGKNIYIVGDNDNAGKMFKERIKQELSNVSDNIEEIFIPKPFKDFNEMYSFKGYIKDDKLIKEKKEIEKEYKEELKQLSKNKFLSSNKSLNNLISLEDFISKKEYYVKEEINDIEKYFINIKEEINKEKSKFNIFENCKLTKKYQFNKSKRKILKNYTKPEDMIYMNLKTSHNNYHYLTDMKEGNVDDLISLLKEQDIKQITLGDKFSSNYIEDVNKIEKAGIKCFIQYDFMFSGKECFILFDNIEDLERNAEILSEKLDDKNIKEIGIETLKLLKGDISVVFDESLNSVFFYDFLPNIKNKFLGISPYKTYNHNNKIERKNINYNKMNLPVILIQNNDYINRKDILDTMYKIKNKDSYNKNRRKILTVEELEKVFPFEYNKELYYNTEKLKEKLLYNHKKINEETKRLNIPYKKKENKELFNIVKNKLDGLLTSIKDENIKDKYIKRFNKEISVINNIKDFDKYLLILKEGINFLEKEGYYKSYGRGSAVGSLIVYLLGITNIDPVENNLLFERFVNLDRNDYPDVDIDLSDKAKEELISFYDKKYGTAYLQVENKFGVLEILKSILIEYNIKDIDYEEIKYSYDKTYTFEENTKNIKELFKLKEKYNKEYELLKKISGTTKSYSNHPSGVIIGEIKEVPFKIKQNDKKKIVMLNKNNTEKKGMIKYDFLSSNFMNKVEFIKNYTDLNYGEEIKIFNFTSNIGIFQLGSEYASNILSNYDIKDEKDIQIINALIRTSRNVDNFILQKKKEEYLNDYENFKNKEMDNLNYSKKVIGYVKSLLKEEILSKLIGKTTILAKDELSYKNIKNHINNSKLITYENKKNILNIIKIFFNEIEINNNGEYIVDKNKYFKMIKQIEGDKYIKFKNETELKKFYNRLIKEDKEKIKTEEDYRKEKIYKEITKDTYGEVLYQEQTMNIFNKIGGFSLKETDSIRKLLTKTDEENHVKINNLKEKFVNNSKIGKRKAEKLFNDILSVNKFTFNKSHNIAYSKNILYHIKIKEKEPELFYLTELKFGNDTVLKELKEKEKNKEINIYKFLKDKNKTDKNYVDIKFIKDFKKVVLKLTNEGILEFDLVLESFPEMFYIFKDEIEEFNKNSVNYDKKLNEYNYIHNKILKNVDFFVKMGAKNKISNYIVKIKKYLLKNNLPFDRNLILYHLQEKHNMFVNKSKSNNQSK